MGKTYRKADKKFKKRLKNDRKKRKQKRGGYEEPKRKVREEIHEDSEGYW